MSNKRTESKKVLIQRRFTVWARMEVRADTLQDAMVVLNDISFNTMFKPLEGTELIDVTDLPGTGVREIWE